LRLLIGFRDILPEKNNSLNSIPFGGKVVVLGGDPKQYYS
jgi:hypothetical protein